MKGKIITRISLLVIMGIIFYFSAQPGHISDESSYVIVDKLITTLSENNVISRETNRLETLRKTINIIVRKSAHVMIFLTLSFTMCFSLKYTFTKWTRVKILIVATISSILYAFTDEYHQTFVPNRSGNLTDVGIDTIGIFLGVLCFFVLNKFIIPFIINKIDGF